MFDLNGTFFIFIVMFLGFVFLFNEIALKPVGQVIEARKKLIQGDLEAAQRSKEDAASVLSAYEERLQASRMEGQRIIQEVLQSGQAKRKEELARIHEEGNKKIEQIRSELASERGKLISQLVDSEIDLVQSIVKKLLGESATIAIDRQQVQKALEEAS
jgi:F-type H+-transporting ATPase subunit b